MSSSITSDIKTQKIIESGIIHANTRPLQDKAFIARARVLKLYRQALRTARRAPIHARDELRNTTRQEIEKNRHCDDKQKVRFLVSEGYQRLKELDEMLDMQGHR
ncbi:uncharacterized protein LOC109850492 isoform X1 [Asparagus officinalis]|uniref:uncharacterized protein LOC109850492 isoform X1 n=1 Tax=Asparagus officinalis TaxID=4686 RepID=UPI00098E5A6E|nr:uncharacterized protein LOC109850492 isoform X1 [Asparagus officinalis]XP_020276094.1 uncharacterized protein LOC109850492 isoform X1 [Asparagus officinalis]